GGADSDSGGMARPDGDARGISLAALSSASPHECLWFPGPTLQRHFSNDDGQGKYKKSQHRQLCDNYEINVLSKFVVSFFIQLATMHLRSYQQGSWHHPNQGLYVYWAKSFAQPARLWKRRKEPEDLTIALWQAWNKMEPEAKFSKHLLKSISGPSFYANLEQASKDARHENTRKVGYPD
uniref:Uncharacterized protein n=1 Tax=Oryza glaberrima TaxID=4538 RepID=I1P522_ORYGL